MKIANLVFVPLALLTVILLASACTTEQPPLPPPVAEPEPAPDLEHRVTYSGETLAVISKHYTGRSDNWKRILAVNPGLRPERLRMGMVIKIPHQLVVNSSPFKPNKAELLTHKKASTPEQLGGSSAAEELPDDTESVVDLPPVKAAVVNPPAAPAGREPTDAEREKLLEELLKQ